VSYRIYSDGASRGNPGPSGIGAVILDGHGKIVHEISQYIGETTNNVAEYSALLAALDHCVAKKWEPVEVCADSELLIRQLEGKYKVKHPNLVGLHQKALALLGNLTCLGFRHVPRELNKLADSLANEGIDNHFSKK